MYASATHRLFAVLARPAITSCTSSPSIAALALRRPSFLPVSAHSCQPLLHRRCFARRSYDDLDDDRDDRDVRDALDVDEPDTKGTEEELEEEMERRLARGPSKAERLRLKEKEKRRQKLAMRERVDNKKDKAARSGQRGRKARVVDEADDFDVDDAIELFDEAAEHEAADTPVDFRKLASTHAQQQQAGPPLDALIAERQRQKKEALRRRFEQQDEGEEEDEEEEKAEDKDERAVNEAITAPAIVLIDGAGKRIGLVATPVALRKARESDLDIVTLSPPHISPPICRVVNYHDWLHLERIRKGQQEPAKKPKTIQLRKLIDAHDLAVKAEAMRRFLKAGHQVRVQYFEKDKVEGEWAELFARVAALVDGAGVCQDTTSKPTAVFEPVRAKKEGGGEGKQGKKENAKKEPQPQKQLPVAGWLQKPEGDAVAPSAAEREKSEIKQQAKASGE